jgi:hypothetical protein
MSSDFWGTRKPLKNDKGMSIGEEKPKIGEEYYYLVLDKTTVKAVKKKWKGDISDMNMFMTDNIYRSKENAELDKDRFE